MEQQCYEDRRSVFLTDIEYSAARSRCIEAVEGRQNSCREKSYRVDAATPARATGRRAALESIVGNRGEEIMIWRFN